MSKPEDIAAALASAIGGNDEESTVSHYLDTGFPPLNFALSSNWNKGLPVGRIVEIAGPPSSGKTAIATRAMAACQAQGGVAGFMDHERSFSVRLAPQLGLDVTPGRFVFKKPKTFEDSVAIFHTAVKAIRDKKLIDKDAPICWVFDSLAAMVPQSVLYDTKTGKERTAEDRNMNDNTALARATSAHFPSIAMIAEEYNVCVIFLNQLRTKIGVMFGDPRKTTGGDSAAYYFSQRIWLGSSQVKKGKEIVGTEVTGKLVKNKVARPFLEAKWRFMFQKDGTGRFDAERSLIDFLEAEGCLPKGRPGYVEWEGKQVSRDNLADLIRNEGPTGFDKLKALLPPSYEPEVVAFVEGVEGEAA
jgi:protein RecA